MSALETPPLAVYLHFPWCVRKCPYCDFNSFTLHDTLPEDAYVAALKADIAAQAPALEGRPVVSVFLGGGTPSLFSPQAIGDVLATLHALLPLAPGAEVTLEANPATVERGRFAEYRAAGVTRVSLGAQSFDPDILKVLGRIHVPADVIRSAEELHASGLSNFNLDLMFALPGQTRAGATADLRAALALEPAHLSHYQLTMEPGTVFAAQPPPGLPDDELAWTLQEDCHAELAARGYAQYEVSAFARAGRQCVHNLNYWRFGDYLGAGAGAHGKLTGSAQGAIERTTHQREPRRYLARPVEGLARRIVESAELPFEFAMNALRLVDGFETADFTARTGLPAGAIEAPLASLAVRGLAKRRGEGWQTTPLGFRFLNDVLGALLPSPKSETQTRA
jgi:oxygen-independent coproporphyrinogen-3 oxidase